MNNKNECGCGRSPTGFCIGWHNLSETDYKAKLALYEERQKKNRQLNQNLKFFKCFQSLLKPVGAFVFLR